MQVVNKEEEIGFGLAGLLLLLLLFLLLFGKIISTVRTMAWGNEMRTQFEVSPLVFCSS